MWFLCIKFLNVHSKECIGWQSRQPEKYFTNYRDVVRNRDDENPDEEETGSTKDQDAAQQGPEKDKPSTALAENAKKKK